jgi:hypothetical protein
MAKPMITEAGKHIILTYELPSIAALSRATDQVYAILKAVARRDEFSTIKKSTTVKIDQNGNGSHALRMHFIIPANTMNPAVLEAILEEDAIEPETVSA